MNNENRKWCVYIHVNKINGKVYIGKTSRSTRVRWNNGKGYEGQGHFWHAINKYGWDNFEHKVVYNGLTKEESSNKERELIAKYLSMNPEYGYNQTAGGEGMLGWHHNEHSRAKIIESNRNRTITEETKKKMSFQMVGKYSGEKNPFYGKTHSEETKRKISEANIGRTGVKWTEERKKMMAELTSKRMKGRKISEKQRLALIAANTGRKKTSEERRKLSESNRGKNNAMYGKHGSDNPNSRKVVQYDMYGNLLAVFDSAVDAKYATGCSNSSIGKCVVGKFPQVGGFIWRYEGDAFDKYAIPQKSEYYTKPVVQYDLEGNIIKRFDNLNSMDRKFNKYKVKDVCDSGSKTYNGFVWRYDGDDFCYSKYIRNNPVIEFDLAGNRVAEYVNMSHASEVTGAPVSKIHACCKGTSNKYKGHIFLYKDSNIAKRLNEILNRSDKKIKPVVQYTKIGEFVAEYGSITEASKQTGFLGSGISQCCHGKIKTFKNFIWMLKES